MKPKRLSRIVLVVALAVPLLGIRPASHAAPAIPLLTSVFINEFHYDNTGTDAGEAVEIAGPAGTDLTGWSIVLYNGSTSLVYDTDALSGVIPDQQGGFGTVVLSYPVNGIQNGAPDGMALVDAGLAVVQFLSYEGVITALDGPAVGLTSTDIGVSETGSEPIGQSLQLTGTGTVYEDFTWSSPMTNTLGAVNTGQTFEVVVNQPVVADCDGPLTTTEGTAATTQVSATDADGTVIDILINSVTPSPAPGSITLSNLVPAPGVALTATADVTADALVPVGAYSVEVVATNDDPTPQTGTCSLSVIVNSPLISDLLINEVDADTASTDVLEFVELFDGGAGGSDLTGLVVVFFNGSDDLSYLAFDLDGFSTDAGGYFLLGNASVIPTPSIIFSDNTLQNGADAVALYQADATDFPNGTPVTTLNLVDAIVYDTDDADDAGLLVLLNAGQPQVNENGAGDKDNDSNGRCPDGAGGPRNTDQYEQADSTPLAANQCAPEPVAVTIMQIQGAAHKSIYEGLPVKEVPGIVTAVASNGFYMQDALGDGDIATSDGIFVFTSSAPTVAVGDSLLVAGSVSEFYPGGFDTGNLSTTELVSPVITVLSTGNALPAATVIGNGGRVPPDTIIEDDATGDVETTGIFDPTEDGIDFYESLEGMRLQLNDAAAVGPTNVFGELPLVGDLGANAGVLTPRGGIVIQATDFNPERVILDNSLLSVPTLTVGDHISGAVSGVLDYSFGNFKLQITEPFSYTASGLALETAAAPLPGQVSIAAFNVENLDPTDAQSKFDGLAHQIVNHLLSPDILSIEEVQDNTGAVDDGVVDASDSWNALIAAIAAAGGPAYEFRDIAPENNADGGEPGGNIRVGFLFRTDRGVTFMDRPGGDATTGTSAVSGGTGVELTFSPGRIDPTNSAWLDSRKPLAGEFLVHGRKLIVIANHWNSKGGDDPLFGRVQPPVLDSEVQRLQQAQVVNDFVDSILALDPDALVAVAGDLNDFPFSAPLATVEAGALTNLHSLLPLNEQYTFVFDGNSQVLDHILFSDGLMALPQLATDVVHMNAECPSTSRHTDHDAVLAYACTDDTAPSLSVAASPNALIPPSHRYRLVTVTPTFSDDADSATTLTLISVTSDEPDNGEQDGNTVNDIVIVDDFHFLLRAERSGIGDGRTYTITYQASDACGNSTTATTTVFVPLSAP